MINECLNKKDKKQSSAGNIINAFQGHM